MIVGIGADVVDIARIAQLLDRYGERFARRILGEREWNDFRSSPHPERYLASRFAAKEAFGKAFGTGLRAPVLLTHINIEHDGLGRPWLWLTPQLQAASERRGVKTHHVTLTHERSIACAFVVLEA